MGTHLVPLLCCSLHREEQQKLRSTITIMQTHLVLFALVATLATIGLAQDPPQTDTIDSLLQASSEKDNGALSERVFVEDALQHPCRTKLRAPTCRKANTSRILRAHVPPSGRATTTTAAVMAMMGVAAGEEALAERRRLRRRATRTTIRNSWNTSFTRRNAVAATNTR